MGAGVVGKSRREDRLAEALMPHRGFRVLTRRWVVERTFSWLAQNVSVRKDYERLCASAEAFVYAAMIRLMARRLARA